MRQKNRLRLLYSDGACFSVFSLYMFNQIGYYALLVGAEAKIGNLFHLVERVARANADIGCFYH